jgi:hypothetical protein
MKYPLPEPGVIIRMRAWEIAPHAIVERQVSTRFHLVSRIHRHGDRFVVSGNPPFEIVFLGGVICSRRFNPHLHMVYARFSIGQWPGTGCTRLNVQAGSRMERSCTASDSRRGRSSNYEMDPTQTLLAACARKERAVSWTTDQGK